MTENFSFQLDQCNMLSNFHYTKNDYNITMKNALYFMEKGVYKQLFDEINFYLKKIPLYNPKCHIRIFDEKCLKKLLFLLKEIKFYIIEVTGKLNDETIIRFVYFCVGEIVTNNNEKLYHFFENNSERYYIFGAPFENISNYEKMSKYCGASYPFRDLNRTIEGFQYMSEKTSIVQTEFFYEWSLLFCLYCFEKKGCFVFFTNY